MDIIDIRGDLYVGMTYDEEQNLARAVLDCIALRWVGGGFQTILDHIFRLKCRHGSWLRCEDYMELIKFLEHYELDIPQADAESRQTTKDELFNREAMSSETADYEGRVSVIRAWREIWNDHLEVKKAALRYKTFPGDEQRESVLEALDEDDDIKAILEKSFWEEVNRVTDEYECSRNHAYIMVSDYMPRASMADEVEPEEVVGEVAGRYDFDNPRWYTPGA